MSNQPFHLLERSARNPNANRIKNLLSVKISQYVSLPSTLTALWNRIDKKRHSLTLEYCNVHCI